MSSETDSREAGWQQEGYDTTVKQVAPNTTRPPHTHPFDVRVLILEGELTLECAGGAQSFRRNEGFDLPAGQVHAERFGPQGATLLSGHRSKKS